MERVAVEGGDHTSFGRWGGREGDECNGCYKYLPQRLYFEGDEDGPRRQQELCETSVEIRMITLLTGDIWVSSNPKI